jgi:predicted cupin superfamily sugar epimerase
MTVTADDLIARYDLAPHPEGGWYRQTWIDTHMATGARPSGTAILFLLKAGEKSHWHRVDATEIWHFYAGAPIDLRISPDANGPYQTHVLGNDLLSGHTPQVIVPQHYWQAAHATDGWALVGCTVSPGFDFAGFTLAPPEFDIPETRS